MNKAKKILAIAGLALIALMYTLTFVFAFMQDPRSQGFLMGAIFCTIAVPVVIYAMQLVAKNLRRKGEELRQEALRENRENPEDQDNQEDLDSQQDQDSQDNQDSPEDQNNQAD